VLRTRFSSGGIFASIPDIRLEEAQTELAQDPVLAAQIDPFLEAELDLTQFESMVAYVADSAPYLHGGRADTLADAIHLHNGEARRIRQAFERRPLAEQDAVLAFLGALRSPVMMQAEQDACVDADGLADTQHESLHALSHSDSHHDLTRHPTANVLLRPFK